MLIRRRLEEKDISGCGLAGIISRQGRKIKGDMVVQSVCSMPDRGNGLGAGYAGYGIYPDFKDFFAFHLMYHDKLSQETTEAYLKANFSIKEREEIPTRPVKGVSPPLLWRYFLKVKEERLKEGHEELSAEDYVVRAVMEINYKIDGAYVFSSGKNMGAFKGVGFPWEIAEFFRVEEYEGYLWIGHSRFPTNTPGWWGGAHPFTLLDWAVVHNGEISSYGINKRYLEMFGYRCTLLTDTEVIAYLFDLLVRRHGLSFELACQALAPAFWKDIDRLPERERETLLSLRLVYGSAVLNGPFAVLFAYRRGLIGFNDRIKLRPLVAATNGDLVYMASEESAIRAIAPNLEKVWSPKAGTPLIAELEEVVPKENP